MNKIMFDTSDIQDTLFLEMVATFKFTKKKLIFEMLINAEKVSSTYWQISKSWLTNFNMYIYQYLYLNRYMYIHVLFHW